MSKLTKLQTIRESLMDQLTKIKDGKASTEEVSSIVSI